LRFRAPLGSFNKHIAIHGMQAFFKYGTPLLYEEGTVVRHLNGDPGSNTWDNIT
jgi:hypothetical protein